MGPKFFGVAVQRPDPELVKKSAEIANREAMRYLSSQITRHLSLRFQGPPLPQTKRRTPDLSKDFLETQVLTGFFKTSYKDQLARKFAPDDVNFILRVGRKFPRVRLGFAYFSLLAVDDCPEEAMHLCELQGRTGYARTSIPTKMIQVVADHQEGTERLANMLFSDDPEFEDIVLACRYHDVAEAITGDFSKYCDISPRDRKRIEKLAFELISPENAPNLSQQAKDIRRCYELTCGTDPAHKEVRAKFKDCDALEMPMEVAFLMTQKLSVNRVQLMDELEPFWKSAESALQYSRSKNFFKVLEQARYRTDLKPESYDDIVNIAVEYMRGCEAGFIDSGMEQDSVVEKGSPRTSGAGSISQSVVQFPMRKP